MDEAVWESLVEELQAKVKLLEELIESQDAERELLVKNHPTTRLAHAASYALGLCEVPIKTRTPTGIAKVMDSLAWMVSTEDQKSTETHSNE